MSDTKVFDFYGTIKIDSSGAVKSLEAVEDRAKKLTDGTVGKISVEFSKAFREIEDASKVDLRGMSDSINKEFKSADDEVSRSIDSIRSKIEELNGVMSGGLDIGVSSEFSNITSEIRDELSGLESYVGQNGVSQVVGADLDKLRSEVVLFESDFGVLPNIIGAAVEGSIEAMGKLVEFADGVFDSLSSFGLKAGVMITAPIVKNAKSIMPKVLDEDDARRRLENMSGIVGAEMDVLESELVAAARDTGTEISDMFRYAYDSSSGGISDAMLGEFTEYVDKVAVVTGTSGEQVSNVMTTMSNVFNAEVSSMANQLLKLEKIGKNSMEQLSSHLGKVMPSANRAGESLQGMNTSLAVLTQSGQNVARSTTHLKNIYEEFGNKYSEVNFMLVESTGETFAGLKEAGMSTAEIFELMVEIGDEAGMSMGELFGESATFLEIIAENADVYNEKFNEMSEATQELEDDLSNLNEGPMQQYKVTLFELEEAFKDLWATAMPVFQDIMEFVIEVSNKFQALDDVTKESIVKFTLLAAVMGPIAGVIGQIGSSITWVAGKVVEFGGVVVAVGGKIFKGLTVLLGFKGAVAVAVVGIVAALGYVGFKIINGNEKIKLSIEKLFIGVQIKFREFVGGILGIFFNLVDKIGEVGAKIFGYDYTEGTSRMRQFADETEEYVRLKEEEQKAIGTKITMLKAEEVAAKKAKENRAMEARFEERERQKKLKESLEIKDPVEVEFRPVDVGEGGPDRDDIRDMVMERKKDEKRKEVEKYEKEMERRRKAAEKRRKEALNKEKEKNRILKERLKIEKSRYEFRKKAQAERDRLRLGSALVNRLDTSLAVVAKTDRYRFDGRTSRYEEQRAYQMKKLVNTVQRIEKYSKEDKGDDIRLYKRENEDLENMLRVYR